MTAQGALPGLGSGPGEEPGYRYMLWRHWDEAGNRMDLDDPYVRPDECVAWVMLNPSTADRHTDDPTIRRCMGFSYRWGYPGMLVVNLYNARCTDPAGLASHEDPVGDPDKATGAIDHASRMREVVCAWGNHGAGDRARAVEAQLVSPWAGWGAPAVVRLGELTSAGEPRHPLYVPYSTPRVNHG